MTKSAKSILVLAAVFLLVLGSTPCWAKHPGTFARALIRTYCDTFPVSGGEYHGCSVYMFYRVDYSMTRD